MCMSVLRFLFMVGLHELSWYQHANSLDLFYQLIIVQHHDIKPGALLCEYHARCVVCMLRLRVSLYDWICMLFK